MKTFYDDGTVSEKGFIYVATVRPFFYEVALHSLQTLKDFYPEANVTLFANEALIDDRAKRFNKVYTNVPVHQRTKMWCLDKTPYDQTVYIDADTVVLHKDIRTIHDHLADCDMFFAPNPTWACGSFEWAYVSRDKEDTLDYQGGMFGYNKNDLVQDFTNTWFTEYCKQREQDWPYDPERYSREWQQFDMFTLWKITSNKFGGFDRFEKLKIKQVPHRWGVIMAAPKKFLDGPIVIAHCSRDYYQSSPASANLFKMSKEYESFKIKSSSTSSSTFQFN